MRIAITVALATAANVFASPAAFTNKSNAIHRGGMNRWCLQQGEACWLAIECCGDAICGSGVSFWPPVRGRCILSARSSTSSNSILRPTKSPSTTKSMSKSLSSSSSSSSRSRSTALEGSTLSPTTTLADTTERRSSTDDPLIRTETMPMYTDSECIPDAPTLTNMETMPTFTDSDLLTVAPTKSLAKRDLLNTGLPNQDVGLESASELDPEVDGEQNSAARDHHDNGMSYGSSLVADEESLSISKLVHQLLAATDFDAAAKSYRDMDSDENENRKDYEHDDQYENQSEDNNENNNNDRNGESDTQRIRNNYALSALLLKRLAKPDEYHLGNLDIHGILGLALGLGSDDRTTTFTPTTKVPSTSTMISTLTTRSTHISSLTTASPAIESTSSIP